MTFRRIVTPLRGATGLNFARGGKKTEQADPFYLGFGLLAG
jgi:hypothetical protein